MTEQAKKRILILDDEKDICEILKTRFQKFGFEVLLAHDGKQAFQKVIEGNPDCILLDIRIQGGEDGLTFLRKLRSYRDDNAAVQTRVRGIPVIVLTATGENMRSLFEVEGISDFVDKPFDSNKLKDRILDVLAKQK